MASFTDYAGRGWTLRLDVNTLRRVRTLASVDLMEFVSGNLAARLAADPALLADTLYAMVKPQADSLNIDATAFGEGLYGDSIGAAASALTDAVMDFLSSQDRENLASVRGLVGKVLAKGAERLRAKVSELEAQLEADPDQVLLTLMRQSGNAPASSASIPDRSRSERLSPSPVVDGVMSGTAPVL